MIIEEDFHQSQEYTKYMKSINWDVVTINASEELKPRINIFLRKIGPFRIAKIQRSKYLPDLKELLSILKTNKVFMCKIEPDYDSERISEKLIADYHFKIDKSPLLGTKTIRVDISAEQNKILSSFKKDCRYVLKKLFLTNHNIEIGNSDKFYEIWRISAKRKNLWIPNKNEYLNCLKAFENKAFVITVDNEAGALILIHNKTAFYFYAGATKIGTKNNLPYLVVWEAIKEAKNRGCRTWDFEGIFDTRWPNKSWKGFSHFKRGFGGDEVNFPGCFSLWRLPI